MLSRLWYLLVGSPLPTQEFAHKRLNKSRALANASAQPVRPDDQDSAALPQT